MKEIFRERDPARVGFYQSLLEAEGIPTHVRNRDLATGMGTEVPIPEFFPALCVVNEEDYEAAIELLKEASEGEPPAVNLPHETKGIVVIGVSLICSILIAAGLSVIVAEDSILRSPDGRLVGLIVGIIMLMLGILGIRSVVSSYRKTKQRNRDS